jgi:hypothetical protein
VTSTAVCLCTHSGTAPSPDTCTNKELCLESCRIARMAKSASSHHIDAGTAGKPPLMVEHSIRKLEPVCEGGGWCELFALLTVTVIVDRAADSRKQGCTARSLCCWLHACSTSSSPTCARWGPMSSAPLTLPRPALQWLIERRAQTAACRSTGATHRQTPVGTCNRSRRRGAAACSCSKQAVWRPEPGRTWTPAARRVCSRLGRKSSSGARAALPSAPGGSRSRGLTTTSSAENERRKALSSSSALTTPAANPKARLRHRHKQATAAAAL